MRTDRARSSHRGRDAAGTGSARTPVVTPSRPVVHIVDEVGEQVARGIGEHQIELHDLAGRPIAVDTVTAGQAQILRA